MLHPTLLAELLDDEVRVAAERLGERAEHLRHDGRYVCCRVTGQHGGPVWLTLDGGAYDAEPVSVDVRDDDGEPVPLEQWPAGLAHSIHPVHHRPWVCTRGVAEFFTYPGHHLERWDNHRTTTRIPELLDHLLRRLGR